MFPARAMILAGGAGLAGLAVFDGVGVGARFGLFTVFVRGFGEAEAVGTAAGLVDGVMVGTDVVCVPAEGVVVLVEGLLNAVAVAARPDVSGAALQAAVSAMDRAPSAPSAPLMTRARP